MARKKKVTIPVQTSIIPTKSNVGRRCSVCTHEKTDEINAEIRVPSSFRAISRQFGMSKDSVQRHTENCLKLEIAALIKAKKIQGAIDHYEEIRKQLEFAKELQQAAREWLTDPNTGGITLEPRAEEVQVIWLDHADLNAQLKPKKKKEKLSDIIDNVQGIVHTFQPTASIIQTADLRNYALDTIKIVDLVLDKFARVDGHYVKERENDEFTSLKMMIERRAGEKGISYQLEIKNYLQNFGMMAKPQLKQLLEAELEKEN